MGFGRSWSSSENEMYRRTHVEVTCTLFWGGHSKLRMRKQMNERTRTQGHVYDPDLIWLSDPVYLDVLRRFPEAGPNATIGDRHFALFSVAKSVRNLPGDTAECGVYRGLGSFVILASVAEIPEKMHHVFDSFEGLSKPEDRDHGKTHNVVESFENLSTSSEVRDQPSQWVWREHMLAVGEDVVARNLAAFKNFRLYRGWIPFRFAEVAERRFSFVHLDVDLYRPTFDSMAFFYPRMSPGGIILCDDYGFISCPGAKRAVDEFLADRPETVIQLTSGQGMIVKQ